MRSIETPLTLINAVTRTVTRTTSPLPPWLVIQRLQGVDHGIRTRIEKEEDSPVGHWRIQVYVVGDGITAYLLPGGYSNFMDAVEEAAGRRAA